MKTTRLFCSMLAVAGLALVVQLTLPMNLAAQEPEMSDEAKETMNAWMALASPGVHHQHLARYVGKWTSEVSMWMEPGGEPMVDQAEAEARWILGDRYLEWTVTGNFGGMPFEAHQIDGYDNGGERYQATWLDNFGTLTLSFVGECDGEGKGRTMHSEFTDPVSGAMMQNRVVYTWDDDDHYTYESFMKMGGEEYKNMVIKYSRVK